MALSRNGTRLCGYRLMAEPLINARGVSMRYRIGAVVRPPDSLREALAGMVRAPWRRMRSLGMRVEEAESFWALDDVSFDVSQGEVVGLLGRNGAGKSTTLKVLSRITEPTRGRIELRGRVASLLEVGTGFHAELTGRENVYMNGTILGMRRREVTAKFDEIVAFSEIEKFIDTPVKRYSSGMYVRLAFAVAAHLEPEILVVDEVLAVGDAEFQNKCLGKMNDVAHSGRTVLFVSHNMASMRALCTRAIVLNKGRLEMDGAVEPAIRAYLEQTHVSEGTDWIYRWRSPTPRVVIDDVELLVDDAPSRTVQAGDKCTIRLHYSTTAPEFRGARFSPRVEIFADGQKFTTVAPSIRDGGSGVPAEEFGTLDCTFQRWPLRARNIRVDVVGWVGMEPQEHIYECLNFASHDGDYFRSGNVPKESDGFMFVDHAWSASAAHSKKLRLSVQPGAA
jgi:lipopolysaccharide transport system ATP-binding protein